MAGAESAKDLLEKRLSQHEATADVAVRKHGKNVILSRQDARAGERVDMVRLTHLGGQSFGLSFKDHRERWQQLPFEGSAAELADLLLSDLAHLIGPI